MAPSKLAKYLNDEFDIKHPRQLHYFLGIEVACSSKGILLCQWKYIIDLHHKLRKEDSQPINL